jgi:hypothetical protein
MYVLKALLQSGRRPANHLLALPKSSSERYFANYAREQDASLPTHAAGSPAAAVRPSRLDLRMLLFARRTRFHTEEDI